MNKRQRLVWRTEVFEILRGVWAGKTRGRQGAQKDEKTRGTPDRQKGRDGQGHAKQGMAMPFFPSGRHMTTHASWKSNSIMWKNVQKYDLLHAKN